MPNKQCLIEQFYNAMDLARYVYDNKPRFGSGEVFSGPEQERMIEHPLRVAAYFLNQNDLEGAIVGLLHDILEDDIGAYKIVADKFKDDIGVAIRCLTRAEGEEYFEYIKRLSRNSLAKRVKIADIKDNLREDRRKPRTESLRPRYFKALKMLGEDIDDWEDCK